MREAKPKRSRAEKRAYRKEIRACREGGRPCRHCSRNTDLRLARRYGWA